MRWLCGRDRCLFLRESELVRVVVDRGKNRVALGWRLQAFIGFSSGGRCCLHLNVKPILVFINGAVALYSTFLVRTTPDRHHFNVLVIVQSSCSLCFLGGRDFFGICSDFVLRGSCGHRDIFVHLLRVNWLFGRLGVAKVEGALRHRLKLALLVAAALGIGFSTYLRGFSTRDSLFNRRLGHC